MACRSRRGDDIWRFKAIDAREGSRVDAAPGTLSPRKGARHDPAPRDLVGRLDPRGHRDAAANRNDDDDEDEEDEEDETNDQPAVIREPEDDE